MKQKARVRNILSLAKGCFFIFIVVIFSSCHDSSKKSKDCERDNSNKSIQAKPIEDHQSDTTITFDWNHDGKLDSFILKGSSYKKQYLSFTIKITGHKPFVLDCTDSMTTIWKLDNQYVDPDIQSLNLIKSDAIAFIKLKSRAQSPIYLYVSGISPSEYPPQYILGLDSAGDAKILYDGSASNTFLISPKNDKNYMILADTSEFLNLKIGYDRNNDAFYYNRQTMGYIGEGIKSLSNGKGSMIESYQLWHVFKLNGKNQFEIDSALTILETKKRNYGLWAGYSSKTDMIMVKPSKTQPWKLMEEKDAIKFWNKL